MPHRTLRNYARQHSPYHYTRTSGTHCRYATVGGTPNSTQTACRRYAYNANTSHTPKDNKKSVRHMPHAFLCVSAVITADDFSYYAFPAHAKQPAVGVELLQALP